MVEGIFYGEGFDDCLFPRGGRGRGGQVSRAGRRRSSTELPMFVQFSVRVSSIPFLHVVMVYT